MKIVIAGAAAVLLATAAQAGTVTVHYHDADLATPQAAGAFYNTLEKAAHKACRSNEALSLEVRRVTQECQAVALDIAIAEINHENLWKHHDKPRDATIMISQKDGEADDRIKLAKTGS